MKKKNIFLFFFFIFLFIFLFNFVNYSIGKNNFEFIRKHIPIEIKNLLKDNIFIIKKLRIENNILKKENDYFENQENFQTFTLNSLNYENSSKLNLFGYSNLNLFKYKLPFWTYHGTGKPVAYIDSYDNNIVIVSGKGDIIYLKIEENFEKNIKKFKTLRFDIILSNIKNIILDYEFYKTKSLIGIRDIKIIDDFIYLSFNDQISKNCYNTSIIRAKMDLNYLKFNKFIKFQDCALMDHGEFNPNSSGGRMIEYKNHHMLFSTGDYRKRDKAQDDNSMLGKILLVNLEDGKYKIFSKGHRNPQGLLYLPEEDIILSTEHGPRGGDEINKIEENKNYGWPVSSYGEHYCLTDTITKKCESLYKKFPVYKSHKDYDFVEPLKYYVPSIAPSEIVKIPPSFSKNINNSFFVSSLTGDTNLKEIKHGLSIFNIQFDSKYSKILSSEKLYLGERIRDLFYHQKLNFVFLILEKSPSFTIIIN